MFVRLLLISISAVSFVCVSAYLHVHGCAAASASPRGLRAFGRAAWAATFSVPAVRALGLTLGLGPPAPEEALSQPPRTPGGTDLTTASSGSEGVVATPPCKHGALGGAPEPALQKAGGSDGARLPFALL